MLGDPMGRGMEPAWFPAWEACPKCGGQYHRHGMECQCYMCCFEWDLREPADRVLLRARRVHRPSVDPSRGELLDPAARDEGY